MAIYETEKDSRTLHVSRFCHLEATTNPGPNLLSVGVY